MQQEFVVVENEEGCLFYVHPAESKSHWEALVNAILLDDVEGIEKKIQNMMLRRLVNS